MTVLMVTTSVSGRDAAREIARTLVDEQLAACVQLTGIESVYRWDGAVEVAEEYRLEIKSGPAARGRLIPRLEQLHPYDVPEILIAETAASEAYAAWAREQTAAPNP